MFDFQQHDRRTLAGPAFGLFLLAAFVVMLACDGAWAQTTRLKLVTIGPSRIMMAAGKTHLRPRVAVADRVVVELAAPLQATKSLTLGGRTRGTVARHLGRNMYVVDLPAGTDVVAAAADLRAQPGVLAAAPDTLVYPALVPNDSHYADQYHLAQIKAPLAWDVSTGSPNVVIAIIDSGVYLKHPDLASKIWTNPGEVAGNHKDDDGNGYVDDVHGWNFYDNNSDPNPKPNGVDENGDGEPDEQVNHGTLVAGTAAALGNDGYGCAGVSWGAKIMPLRIFPDDGGTAVSTVVEAINYAVKMKANVINLSIGGDFTDLFTAPITAAFNAGVVVVCAGGNDSQELTDAQSTWESPVCNDGLNVSTDNHVIGVGAVDRNDRKSSYSNFDSSTTHHFIDIMAPGDAIYGDAAYFPAFPAFTSYFQTNSGTSFSSPIVSGLAALLVGQHPEATPATIISMIDAAGDNIDSLNAGYVGKLGGGRINCARALGVVLPPAAARDFAAADTTGDNGGSITLTWRTSPDDGGGSGKVTGYVLFRRAGATGDFGQRTTLPKGSQTFVDTTVTDGTDYYYKLRTTDGTLFTDTDVFGPVQSRNDLSPATVTGVEAYDRPNDQGQAIVVSWDAYSKPSDFKCFTIYRSSQDFSTTATFTPIATVTDATAVKYTDTGVVDGMDYYYAVGVRDTAGNETRNLRAFGPVQSFSNDAITFAAGLHFLGAATVPVDADPATLFGIPAGSFLYARWSPADNHYLPDPLQRPLPPFLQLDLGRGFWVNFKDTVTLHPDGRSAPAGDFNLDVTPGWQQLANPFLGPISFADVTVIYQGAAMDLPSAQDAGIMAAFVWTYDGTAKSYKLAYPALAGQTVLIPAWQGLWVKIDKACTLTISRPVADEVTSAAATTNRPVKRSTASPLSVKWALRLRASSAAGMSTECVAGTASRALTIPEPPPADGAPVLTMGAANASEAGQYAVALAQSSTSAIIWEMRLTNLHAGQPVQVSAPDLSQLPHEVTPLLEDLVSGQAVYLRTSTGYTFTPRAGETARVLRLTATTGLAAALQVQALSAQSARGGGAQVSFTLSAPAACTVSVMNMAGRQVRVVEEEKLHPAGNIAVLWDGRSQLGVKAPAGLYLLRVTAKTPSGQSAQAVSPLRL